MAVEARVHVAPQQGAPAAQQQAQAAQQAAQPASARPKKLAPVEGACRVRLMPGGSIHGCFGRLARRRVTKSCTACGVLPTLRSGASTGSPGG